MATISTPPTPKTPVPRPHSQPQPGASQFSQFRLTTFVDSNPKPVPKKTANGESASVIATQSPVPRPSSVPVIVNGAGPAPVATMNGSREANNKTKENETGTATAHRRTASAATIKIPNNAHNGFGVLDLTPPLPSAGQGKLGQHRDGRVRNPVPRKLKGKTDMRNGNFSVMHMDMSGVSMSEKGGIADRGKEAQRTSENTAKAAREALRDKAAGGGSIKRRRVDGEGQWEPILSQASRVESAIGVGQAILPQVKKEIVHRTGEMTGEEVKCEQARLLTLLRSLNPLAVVDQMCTALAFFGGIPGAPPPADGMQFPESEDANGSGALFVGWLSEIFPDASRRAWSSMEVPKREASVVQGKRPRGRPKGSKASKVRKDKGIKKGRKDGLPNNALIPVAVDGDDPADDDWVDMGIGDDEAAPSGNAHAEDGMIIDLDGDVETPSQAAGKRKVGRPRSSAIKAKQRDANGNETPSVDGFPLSSPSQQHQNVEGNVSSEQQSPSQSKRKPGRPPGSKTKPKEGAPPPSAPKPVKAPKSAKEGLTPTRAKSVVDGSIPAGLAADERAILEAYRKNKALAGPEKAEEPAKKKRKSRAKPKPAQEGGPVSAGDENAGDGDTPTIIAQQLGSAPAPTHPVPQQQTAVPPPPRRQRKGKENVSIFAPSKPTNNMNSGIDPSLQSAGPMSASPHLPPTRSQNQSQSQSRVHPQQPARSLSASNTHTNNNPFASPPMNGMNNTNVITNSMMSIDSIMPSSTNSQQQRQVQGLEAHYERFAHAGNETASPTTYNMGGMSSHGQGQGQRGSPAVNAGMAMQRANSQQQQQQQQRQNMTRSPQKSISGLGSTANMNNSNNMYYGQGPNQQQQQTRHIPSQSQGYGYSSGSGMVQNQNASKSHSYNMDFGATGNPRGSLGSNMNQLPSSGNVGGQRGSGGYGVQNQNQGYFDNTNVTGGYVDLPALETGLGGASGLGGNASYGVGGMGGVSGGARSQSYSGGGIGSQGMGGGLFGTEQGVGISESEMGDRLLRGIGSWKKG